MKKATLTFTNRMGEDKTTVTVDGYEFESNGWGDKQARLGIAEQSVRLFVYKNFYNQWEVREPLTGLLYTNSFTTRAKAIASAHRITEIHGVEKVKSLIETISSTQSTF